MLVYNEWFLWFPPFLLDKLLNIILAQVTTNSVRSFPKLVSQSQYKYFLIGLCSWEMADHNARAL